jgi:hypothetical protein
MGRPKYIPAMDGHSLASNEVVKIFKSLLIVIVKKTTLQLFTSKRLGIMISRPIKGEKRFTINPFPESYKVVIPGCHLHKRIPAYFNRIIPRDEHLGNILSMSEGYPGLDGRSPIWTK